MNFEDFIKLGQVRRASRDEQLAKSLLKETVIDMEFFGDLEINEKSARKLVSNYYDFLRSILEAMAALDGYKVYAHEAFTYCLKKKNEEAAAGKFDRFGLLRNKINYYGRIISVQEAKDAIESIKDSIDYLIKKYLGEMR